MFARKSFQTRWIRSTMGTLLMGLLVACGDPVLDLNVKVVVKTCGGDTSLDPLVGGGVKKIRFSVFGPGDAPGTTKILAGGQAVDVTSKTLTIPSIPVGSRRFLVVEALDNKPTPELLARGVAGPFEASGETAVPLTVFLRRVDQFSPAASIEEPDTKCLSLADERAAHTATVLEDGRVLIAGGFKLQSGAPVYLDSTEIFDPKTGALTAGPKLRQARAYHSATHIPGTKYTLIAGGENSSTTGGLRSGEVFDEATNTVQLIQLQVARTRHSAAVPPQGKSVLIVGGYSAGTASSSTEVFDSQTPTKTTIGPVLSEARGDLTAIGVGDSRVVVIGGSRDKTTASKKIDIFATRLNSSTYDAVAGLTLNLSVGRVSPTVAVSKGKIVVVGGFSQKDDSIAGSYSLSSSEVINDQLSAVAPGPTFTQKRGWSSAASLPDGNVLVSGGRTVVATKQQSQDSGELLYVDATSSTLKLENTSRKTANKRELSQLTTLLDGSVLLSGGAQFLANDSRATVGALEVYQPYYTTDKTLFE